MCSETFSKFLFMVGKEMIDADCCEFFHGKTLEDTEMNFT